MFKLRFFVLLIFCVIFFSNRTKGQIVLSGFVSDSDSDPLQGVVVQLIDQFDTTVVFQDITNDNGEYSIQITSVDEPAPRQPGSYNLYQNYPNPFNPSTVIHYELARPANVRIEIYNVLGQKIRTLVNEFQTNLLGRVIWDATDDKGQGVSAGVYFYTLIANGHRIIKKIVLIDGYQGNSKQGATQPYGNNASEAKNISKTVSNNFLLKVSGENIQTFKEEVQLTGNLIRNITVIRTINKNAVFIDTANTQITIASVDTTSYDIPAFNLQIDGNIPDLKVGSVIVDTTGIGEIYVVIDDNKLKKGMGIVTAIQGSLDFLLKDTELEIATPKNRTKQGTDVIENKLPMISNKIYGKVNDKEIYLPFDDNKLIVEIPFLNDTIWQDPNGNFSVSIPEGLLKFSPAVDYQTIYSNRDLALSIISPILSIGALEYLRLITYSDMDLDLKINFHAEGSYDILDKNVKLASYFHSIIIGPVVLTMKITLNLNFDMDVNAAMNITTGYEAKNNIVVGFELPNGPLSKPIYFNEINKIEENILSPQIESEFSFSERLEVIPDIEIYLYGILGANGEVIPYQEFVLNAHSYNDLIDWDCEFALGLDGKISMDLSAFHFDEATKEIVNKDFYGPRDTLYSAPHLEIVSGNNQTGAAGEQLAEPFRVKAVDNYGNLCQLPVNVYWDVTQGNGQLDAANSYYTFSDEYAENYYEFGESAGENRITSYLKKADGTIHGGKIFTATVEESEFETGTMTDQDGNVYKTVKIGEQWWMAENLKVTHYRNDDAIPNVTDDTEWTNLTTGACCANENDINNIEMYGLLYNWYAAADSRDLAPVGWHVPTDDEWKELEMSLGMSQSDANNTGWRGTDEGSKLKATSGWYNNGNGTNESGFTALPGGYRVYGNDSFRKSGGSGDWWISTGYSSTHAWRRHLAYDNSAVARYYYDKRRGCSMRLIKD